MAAPNSLVVTLAVRGLPRSSRPKNGTCATPAGSGWSVSATLTTWPALDDVTHTPIRTGSDWGRDRRRFSVTSAHGSRRWAPGLRDEAEGGLVLLGVVQAQHAIQPVEQTAQLDDVVGLHRLVMQPF
jgi:hypothetical protein